MGEIRSVFDGFWGWFCVDLCLNRLVLGTFEIENGFLVLVKHFSSLFHHFSACYFSLYDWFRVWFEQFDLAVCLFHPWFDTMCHIFQRHRADVGCGFVFYCLFLRFCDAVITFLKRWIWVFPCSFSPKKTLWRWFSIYGYFTKHRKMFHVKHFIIYPFLSFYRK